MKQFTQELTVATHGKGLYEFTAQVENWVRLTEIQSGLLTTFIRHTSASLTIQENADPDVVADLAEFFDRLVKESESWYRHTAEGRDDMTSHIRSALTLTQISIPIQNGSLAFGTWQGIYVFEHRASPHRRTVMLHLLGE